jgi:hypothetical protein
MKERKLVALPPFIPTPLTTSFLFCDCMYKFLCPISGDATGRATVGWNQELGGEEEEAMRMQCPAKRR